MAEYRLITACSHLPWSFYMHVFYETRGDLYLHSLVLTYSFLNSLSHFQWQFPSEYLFPVSSISNEISVLWRLQEEINMKQNQ